MGAARYAWEMVTAGPDEQLVSEPITPARGSFDAAAMARGEPGLPARFTWRGRVFVVLDLLETWKTSTPGQGCGELYLRRHWFRVRAAEVAGGMAGDAAGDTGEGSRSATRRAGPPAKWAKNCGGSGGSVLLTLYCMRQPPRGGGRGSSRRWWLFSLDAGT
jgi:hypothetical protein